MADIKPALTAEEWVAGRKRMSVGREMEEVELDDEAGCFMVSNNLFETMGLTHPDMLSAAIALANAALPDGDPRKLTWDDVETVQRQIVRAGVEYGDNPRLFALIAKLSALLPPRPSASDDGWPSSTGYARWLEGHGR